MSIYETNVTNPKKQLEFYKQLSEQLQRENQQLKIQISAREENYKKLEVLVEHLGLGVDLNQEEEELLDKILFE